MLTERFLARLEGDDGPPLRALVALTFTEKAARELRQRIRARCREQLAAEAARTPAMAIGPARPGGGTDRHVPRILRGGSAAGPCRRDRHRPRVHRSSTSRSPPRCATRPSAPSLRRMLAERDPDLMHLALDYGLRQIREALATLVGHRAAGGPRRLGRAVRRGTRRPLDARSGSEGPARRPAGPAAAVRAMRAEACWQALDAAHPKLQERRADPARRASRAGGRALFRRARWSRFASLAQVSDLGAKGIWPSPEIKESVKNVFESLRKKIDDVLKRLVVNEALTLESAENSLRLMRLAKLVSREYEQVKSAPPRARLRRPAGHDTQTCWPATWPRSLRRLSPRREPIEFVLVDEFQDTDRIQSEILRLLGGESLLPRPDVRGGRRQAVDLSVPRRGAGDPRPAGAMSSRAGPAAA